MQRGSRPRPAFVFSADWHLCRSPWKNRAIRGDGDFALSRVVDVAIRLGVPLLAGGDLFDSASPHPDDLVAARDQVEWMYDAGLSVYFVQGNHDRVVDLSSTTPATPWLAAAHPWAIHLHGGTVDVGPFTVRGLDYQPAGRLGDELTNLANEPVDFLLCHQEWSELTRGGNAQGSLADVPRDRDVLTGDLHELRAGEFRPGRSYYSPGAIHRMAIDEPDRHHVLVFYEDGGFRPVYIPSRMAGRADVADEAAFAILLRDELTFLVEASDRHAARHRLPEALRMPLWRVRYSDAIEDAAARLERAAAGRAHLFALAVKANEVTGEAVDAPDVAPGLLGGLAAYDLSAIAATHGVDEDALRADLARQLGSRAPAATEVAAMVAEILGRPA